MADDLAGMMVDSSDAKTVALKAETMVAQSDDSRVGSTADSTAALMVEHSAASWAVRWGILSVETMACRMVAELVEKTAVRSVLMMVVWSARPRVAMTAARLDDW